MQVSTGIVNTPHITRLDEKKEVMESRRVADLRRELAGFSQGAGNIKTVIEAALWPSFF